ncbi:hypothetical protein NN561_006457 [Cricetulus griseus]
MGGVCGPGLSQGGACDTGRGLAAVVLRPRYASSQLGLLGSRRASKTCFRDARSRTETRGPEWRAQRAAFPRSSAAAMSARCCAGQVSETGCSAGGQNRGRGREWRAARWARIQENPWAGRDAGKPERQPPRPRRQASGWRGERGWS